MLILQTVITAAVVAFLAVVGWSIFILTETVFPAIVSFLTHTPPKIEENLEKELQALKESVEKLNRDEEESAFEEVIIEQGKISAVPRVKP